MAARPWDAILDLLPASQRRIALLEDATAFRIIDAYSEARRRIAADLDRAFERHSGNLASLSPLQILDVIQQSDLLTDLRRREETLRGSSVSALRTGWEGSVLEGAISALAEREAMYELFPALSQLGSPFNRPPSAAEELTLSRVVEELTNIPAAMRDQVETQLLVGALRGDSVPAISRSLRPLVEQNRTRAELATRYAIIKGYNLERVGHYEDVANVLKRYERKLRQMWLTSVDDRACPYCLALHGTVVDIGQSFDLRLTFKGKHLPGWPEADKLMTPPRHPRCRCTVAPYVEGWEVSREHTPDAIRAQARRWARKHGLLYHPSAVLA